MLKCEPDKTVTMQPSVCFYNIPIGETTTVLSPNKYSYCDYMQCKHTDKIASLQVFVPALGFIMHKGDSHVFTSTAYFL